MRTAALQAGCVELVVERVRGLGDVAGAEHVLVLLEGVVKLGNVAEEGVTEQTQRHLAVDVRAHMGKGIR